MTVIQKVGIRAYRSIVKATLTLGEITVIIGPTDSGKSNLPRALRDWAFNAGGVAFVTAGRTMTRVAVVVGEHKVLWEKEVRRNSGVSRYVVVDGRTDEKVSFEKIGLKVPPEVTEITGVRPITVDDVTVRIQFSEQAKPWFLLAPDAWPAGKVSKVIGRISGVDALILANRDLVNRRVALNRDAKKARETVASIKEQLEEFDDLDTEITTLETARACMDRIVVANTTLQSATRLIRQASDTRRRLTAIEREHSALEAVATCVAFGYLGRVDLMETATEHLDRVARNERSMESRRAEADHAREGVTEWVGRLAKLAKSKGLQCPLCDGPAHAECRTALATEAKAATQDPA